MKGFKSIEEFTLKECRMFHSDDEQVAQIIKARLDFLLKKDREHFDSCSTIKDYENYLKTSPDGEYRAAATMRIAELNRNKDKEHFDSCSTIKDYENYLKAYSNGVFRNDAKQRIAELNNNKPASVSLKRRKDIKWIDIKQFLDESRWYKPIADFVRFLKSIFIKDFDKLNIKDSFSEFYNIEEPPQKLFYRRVQNEKGLWGLCKCVFVISQELPIVYNDIQYYGGKEFICVKGNKKGVYHTSYGYMLLDTKYDEIDIITNGYICKIGDKKGVYCTNNNDMILNVLYDNLEVVKGGFICTKDDKKGIYNRKMKKMVVNIEYDKIDVVEDGFFNAVKGHTAQKFNIKGYRIID